MLESRFSVSRSIGSALAFFLIPASALAQQTITGSPVATAQELAATAAYWTAERMAAAKPPPRPVVDATASQPVSNSEIAELGNGKARFYPSWNPGSGLPQPSGSEYTEINLKTGEITESPQLVAPQAINTPPADPTDNVNYGPFQRWTWFGRYTTFPTSVHGKLFALLNGNDIVCSGTVIQRNTVATAGHCLSDGAGSYATKVQFCPSYNAGGSNPVQGCWNGSTVFATSGWHNNADIDRDFGCAVLDTTGTVQNDNIGDVTGWVGLGTQSHSGGTLVRNVFSFGYPTLSPFPGNQIITTISTMAYNLDNNADVWRSTYIGSDMNDGADGGGWLISMRHNSSEYPPVDNDSNLTNHEKTSAVSGPFLVGVNSHQRCMMGTCGTPPTTTSGTFWNEWGSPNFINGADTDDPGDTAAVCFANGGS